MMKTSIVLLGLAVSLPQMANGGGDHSGGVQVIIDQGTNKAFVIDVLEPDDLNDRIVYRRTSETLHRLFQMNPCTSLIAGDIQLLPQFKRVQAIIKDRLNAASGSAPLVSQRILDYLERAHFFVTAFPLPQIHDAQGADPDLQFQGAYFEGGVAYLQLQVLRLLIQDGKYKDYSPWAALLIKESLRYLNFVHQLNLENKVLEATTRQIMNKDGAGLANGRFRAALAELASDGSKGQQLAELRQKVESLDGVLAVPGLNSDIRDKLQLTLNTARAELTHMLALQSADLGPDLTSDLNSLKGMFGFQPGWMKETVGNLPELRPLGLVPEGMAWETETGRLIRSDSPRCTPRAW